MRGARALLAGASVAVGATFFGRALSAKQRAVDRALMEAHNANEEAELLRFQLSNLRQTRTANAAAIRSLERRLAVAEANTIKHGAQADAALIELAAIKRLMEEERHKAAALNTQHAAATDNLRAELHATNADKHELQRRLVDCQAEACRLGAEAKDTAARIVQLQAAKDEEVLSLQDKLSSMACREEVAKAELDTAIQRHALELDSLRVKLQAANAHTSLLRGRLADYQAEARRLGDAAKAAKQQLQIERWEFKRQLEEEEARSSWLMKTVISQDGQLKEQAQLLRIVTARNLELEDKASAGAKAAEAEPQASSADAGTTLRTPSKQGSMTKRAEMEGAPQDAPQDEPEPDSARVLQAVRSFKLRADAPAFAPAPPAMPAPAVAPAPADAPAAPAKEGSMLNPRAAPFVPGAAKASGSSKARVQQAVQAPATKTTPAPKAAKAPKNASQANEAQLAPATEGPTPAPEPPAPAATKLPRPSAMPQLTASQPASPPSPAQPATPMVSVPATVAAPAAATLLTGAASTTLPASAAPVPALTSTALAPASTPPPTSAALPASVALPTSAAPPASAALPTSVAPPASTAPAPAKPGAFFAVRPVPPPCPRCLWIFERRQEDPNDR